MDQLLMSLRTSVQPAGGVISASTWLRLASCASSTSPGRASSGVSIVRDVMPLPDAWVVPTSAMPGDGEVTAGRSTTAWVMFVFGSVELPVRAGWGPGAASAEAAALCRTPRDEDTRQVSNSSVEPLGGVWTPGQLLPPHT